MGQYFLIVLKLKNGTDSITVLLKDADGMAGSVGPDQTAS